jgi:hypothetical protein
MTMLNINNRYVGRKSIARAAMLLLLLSSTACGLNSSDSADFGESNPVEDLADQQGAAVSSSYGGLSFGVFRDLKDGPNSFTGVKSKYFIVAHSAGREGHDNITPSSPGLVKVQGASLVKVGGGNDKYLALFQVKSTSVTINKITGQAVALFVDTSKTLSVTSVRSIDPSIPPGTMKVPGATSSNEIVVYAEDEGGKGTRDQFYMPRAFKHYGQGDDVLYLFTNNKVTEQGAPNGNGAYMKLKIL